MTPEQLSIIIICFIILVFSYKAYFIENKISLLSKYNEDNSIKIKNIEQYISKQEKEKIYNTIVEFKKEGYDIEKEEYCLLNRCIYYYKIVMGGKEVFRSTDFEEVEKQIRFLKRIDIAKKYGNTK